MRRPFGIRHLRPFVCAGALFGAALLLAACSAQYAAVAEKQPHLSGPHGTGLLAAAEQAITRAVHDAPQHPLQALGACLDSLKSSSEALKRDPKDALARRDYNFALGRVFDIIKKSKLDVWTKPLTMPGALAKALGVRELEEFVEVARVVG